MTEVASDANAEIPPVPRRLHRGAPSPSGFGAPVLGLMAAGLLVVAAFFAWRPARFSGALQDLGHENPAVRERARQSLLGMKDYAAKRLPAVASSPAALQRLRAIRGMAALDLKDDTSALDALRKATDEKEATEVQAEAVACLGQFASGGSAEALKALLDLADKAPQALLPALIEALGRTEPSGEASQKLFLEQAGKSVAAPLHPVPGIRAAYLKALGGLMIGWMGAPEAAPSEPALQALQIALAGAADPEPGVRNEADRILQQIPREKRIALALDCLQHEDPWIRVWAEGTLRDLTGRAAGYDPFGPEPERQAAAERWRTLAKAGP